MLTHGQAALPSHPPVQMGQGFGRKSHTSTHTCTQRLTDRKEKLTTYLGAMNSELLLLISESQRPTLVQTTLKSLCTQIHTHTHTHRSAS